MNQHQTVLNWIFFFYLSCIYSTLRKSEKIVFPPVFVFKLHKCLAGLSNSCQ